jgi:asparagine synthase (glutamine-hydrolysing)
MMPSWLKTIARVKEKAYLNDSFAREYSRKSRIADSLYSANNLQSSLLDHFEYKLEHLLKWEDRNSMWFSIEARLPFLDYRLVERTLSLSPDQIIRSGTTKYILRESMKGLLPEKIRMRQDRMVQKRFPVALRKRDSGVRLILKPKANRLLTNREDAVETYSW